MEAKMGWITLVPSVYEETHFHVTPDLVLTRTGPVLDRVEPQLEHVVSALARVPLSSTPFLEFGFGAQHSISLPLYYFITNSLYTYMLINYNRHIIMSSFFLIFL